jgi:site-specific DNA-methyltransferase (adenine-specific)
MNTLYYGDNLKILRDYIKDESVDQAPLLPEPGSPPQHLRAGWTQEGWHRFGDGVVGDSNRNYNVLFKDEFGTEADSRESAFEDTWHWHQQAEETYHELINQPDEVGRMIEAFRSFIGTNQMTAYLVMIALGDVKI